MDNKNVLLTGATGFIGSHLLEPLGRRNYQIYALVRKNNNRHYLNNNSIKIIEGDLLDTESLKLIPKDVNVVIHAGALMSNWDGASRDDFCQTNVVGTKNLISSLLDNQKLEHFIHISTVGVYGNTGNEPKKECAPYGKNLSHYEWSKAEAEKLLLGYVNKIPMTILRIGLLYGPRMRYGWTNAMDMIRKNKMAVIGNGKALIQLTYIDDAIEGIIGAICNEKCKREIFNICGIERFPLGEVFKVIAEELGSARVKSMPYYPIYVLAAFLEFIPSWIKPEPLRLLTCHRVSFFRNSHLYDISKANEYFGYTPNFKIREGVKRMVAWYLSESLARDLYEGGR